MKKDTVASSLLALFISVIILLISFCIYAIIIYCIYAIIIYGICWAFGISFSFKYPVGVWLASIILKGIFKR